MLHSEPILQLNFSNGKNYNKKDYHPLSEWIK